MCFLIVMIYHSISVPSALPLLSAVCVCVCVCADYSRQVQEEVVAQSRAYDELLKTLSRTSNGYSAQLSPSSSRLSLSLGSPP